MYALHAAHEEKHWWYVARRRIVLDLLARELPDRRALRLVDVGCGAGGMLPHLRRFGTVTGVDPSPDIVAHARTHAGDVRVGALPHSLPFHENETFDVVTLLDVVEHVDDDAAALRTLRDLLQPGGTLILTVPAFPFLWSAHDVVNEHRRRYTKAELRRKLHDAGFVVRALSYYNTALFLPIVAVRLIRSLAAGADEVPDTGLVPEPVNGLLCRIFAAERHLIGRVPLPFGVSLIAAARRPG